jgi:hypothetical protein
MGHISKLVLRMEEKGYCKKGVEGVPTGVGRYIHCSPAVIVRHFRALAVSLCHYYTGATNYSRMK